MASTNKIVLNYVMRYKTYMVGYMGYRIPGVVGIHKEYFRAKQAISRYIFLEDSSCRSLCKLAMHQSSFV